MVGEIATAECEGCSAPFRHAGNVMATNPIGNAAVGVSAYGRYRCTECAKDFCVECDLFVHEVLHVCPGCR